RANQPRCLACGGSLEETEPSLARHVRATDAMAIATGRRTGQESKEIIREDGITCENCGLKFTEAPVNGNLLGMLKRHLKYRTTCATAFGSDSLIRLEARIEAEDTVRVSILRDEQIVGSTVCFGGGHIEIALKVPRSTRWLDFRLLRHATSVVSPVIIRI